MPECQEQAAGKCRGDPRGAQKSALSAFIEHGCGGVSIDAIAREARVTKGALYHHFGRSRN
ncbi:helix-turn-helix domain containing protein [Pseudomonas aeruginosa]|nr:helix-turn-helix domain containing protein [Pseudomonas aeruginosa]